MCVCVCVSVCMCTCLCMYISTIYINQFINAFNTGLNHMHVQITRIYICMYEYV